MSFEHARIHGVLQDWDLCDYRYDIEEVSFDFPTFLLDAYTDDEIECMLEDGFGGCDDYTPMYCLMADIIECGFWKPRSHWEMGDPCELKLTVLPRYHR